MNEISFPLEDWQVSELLSHLVDKSLVVFEPDADGGGRYRLLETVRQYGDGKLHEDGEAQMIGARHLDYFVRWVEEAHSKLGGPEQNVWFARMEIERDNLRLALETSLVYPDGAQESLRLARAMQHSLHVHGRLAEAHAGLTAALERPGASEPTLARARALTEAGYLAQRRKDSVHARLCLEESVTIFRAHGNNEGIAFALVNLGVQARLEGDNDGARRMQTEAQTLSRAAGVAWLEAIALMNLAEMHWEENELETTHALLEQTVAVWRTLGDGLNEAYALMKLGNLDNKMEKPNEARACFVRALRPLHQSGDRYSLAGALESVSRLDIADARPERAVALLLAAQSLRSSMDLPNEFPIKMLETLRETLGSASFSSAESAGRSQTLTQLIDDVCRDV